MIILSYDQATKVTGWSKFDSDTKKLLDYGTLIVPSTFDIHTRKMLMRNLIHDHIQKHQGEVFAVEDTQDQFNKQVFQDLSELLGAVRVSFIEKEYLHFVIESEKWRKTCGIKEKKREAKKQAAIQFVKEKFNIDASEDECEAICIGWHCVEKEIPKIRKNNPK